MRIVFSEDGQDFHRRGWHELVQADPAGTFFHTPAFLKLYWEEFGETPDHLLLAFAEEDDGTQVGAVAFERIGETLRFLGGTEVTDYMGPVGVPERQDAMAKELWTALLTREDWRDADLRGLPEDQPWFGLLRDAASAQGLGVTEDDDGVSPFLPLPSSWDDYLAACRRSTATRSSGRRASSSRKPASSASSRPTTRRSRRCSTGSWSCTACRRGPRASSWCRAWRSSSAGSARRSAPQGVFRLTFIEVGGQLAAGTIGFVWGGTSYLYNSAFDRSWGNLAPGMVLVGEDIRLAIEEGCRGFDLLKGDYEYKYRFGSSARARETAGRHALSAARARPRRLTGTREGDAARCRRAGGRRRAPRCPRRARRRASGVGPPRGRAAAPGPRSWRRASSGRAGASPEPSPQCQSPWPAPSTCTRTLLPDRS